MLSYDKKLCQIIKNKKSEKSPDFLFICNTLIITSLSYQSTYAIFVFSQA